MNRETREMIILLCILVDVVIIAAAGLAYCWIVMSKEAPAEPRKHTAPTVDAALLQNVGEMAVDMAIVPYVTDSPLVNTALSEVGDKGGEKFWKWFGYTTHVEWCACFVSWCGEQNGYIADEKIPRFDYVPEGVAWFKERKRWKAAGKYTPKAGDIIFFKKKNGRTGVHVGIVASVLGDRVYTVEGNKKDVCRKADYRLDSEKILGYGLVEE